MNLRHYLLLSLASMALFAVDEDMGLLTVGMMVWLGGALALRLRPGLRSIRDERRLPRAGELAAVVIGQAGAMATFLLLALLPLSAAIDWRSPSPDLVAEGIPWLIGAGAAVAPLWLQMGRLGRDDASEPPLWPSAAGLAAGPPLIFGLVFLVHGVAMPLLAERPSAETLIGALMVLPAGALLTAFGAGWIVQATRRRPAAGPVFRAAVLAGLGAWAVVAAAVVLDAAGAFAAVLPPMLAPQGGGARTAYTLVIALAWVRALSSIRRTEVGGPIAATLVAVLLWVGFLVSLWVPVVIPRDIWAPLVAVVLFPVLLVSAAAVAFGVPRLAPWLARGRLRGARPQPV